MNIEKTDGRHCEYNSFKRTRYFHGMLMTDRDFREEQIYHNEKRKLLNRMMHGWGVVCGLGIKGESGNSFITVEPGMALDCRGNEIVVCEPLVIDLASIVCKGVPVVSRGPMTARDCEKLEQAQPNTFYIGIRYDEVPTDPVPVYVPGGGCDEKACEYSRIREGSCVKVFDQPPAQPHRSSVEPSLIRRFFDDCKAELGFGEVNSGTAQGVGVTTIKLGGDASTTSDIYKGMQIEITGGPGAGQTRTITDYDGNTQIATVDSAWNPPIVMPTSSFRVTNDECLRQKVKEFKAFCTEPLPCTDCCPEEHYLILGKVEIEPNKKTIRKLSDDVGRSYVPTTHMFRYIFSSLLGGLDTYFEVRKKDGTSKALPDVNMIHTNPIEALCWLRQVLVDNDSIEPKEKTATWKSIGKKAPIKTSADDEVIKLRSEMENLKKTVAALQKKLPKK